SRRRSGPPVRSAFARYARRLPALVRPRGAPVRFLTVGARGLVSRRRSSRRRPRPPAKGCTTILLTEDRMRGAKRTLLVAALSVVMLAPGRALVQEATEYGPPNG